jgi:hypothetical protein
LITYQSDRAPYQSTRSVDDHFEQQPLGEQPQEKNVARVPCYNTFSSACPITCPIRLFYVIGFCFQVDHDENYSDVDLTLC